jgi:exportin-1
MEIIFNSSLGMITTDFSSYPEIRQTFFEFLKAIIKFNFEQFYNMPGDKFNTSLNCVVWSFKHQLSTFSDLGLDLLL